MPLVERLLDQLAIRGVLISRAFWVLGALSSPSGGRPDDGWFAPVAARCYWRRTRQLYHTPSSRSDG